MLFVSVDETDVASTAFAVLRPNAKVVDPRFLYHWVTTDEFVRALEPLQRGNQPPSVVDDDVRAQLIPVPPLETQHRIVARMDELFSDLDDGEEAMARARTDIETYRKALLRAAVTGELTAGWRKRSRANQTARELLEGLRPPPCSSNSAMKRQNDLGNDDPVDPTGLPRLPDSWVWTTVGRLGSVTGGVTKSAKRAGLPVTLPYLRVANVGAGKLDLERVESIGLKESEVHRVLLKIGDLLIVEGNGSIDQIGRSAIWGGQIDPCVHQNHLIKVRIGDERVTRWLQLWLRSPHGRRELEERANSTSGLHTLSISKIRSVRCPMPPLAELSLLLEQAEDAITAAEAGDREANEMQQSGKLVRQSILAAAFRGKLI